MQNPLDNDRSARSFWGNPCFRLAAAGLAMLVSVFIWGGDQVDDARIREVVFPGKVKMELLRCPSGTFSMGSPAGEANRDPDETQHQVTLTKAFWLGKTEVTQAQWAALMGNHSSWFTGSDLPVENVSWDDAVSFCRKLTVYDAKSIPAGYEYRLPAEAEWEYACRAGSAGPYAGSGLLDDQGWYDANSGKQIRPVASKQPNAWGLYDMHGNVWEWCQDWYGDYPTVAVTDPAGPEQGAIRVFRGGCWTRGAGNCRAGNRGGSGRDYRCNILGFRVALAPMLSTAEPKRQAEPAQVREIILSENVKLELLPCPAGTFMMGSPADEKDRNADETRHQVTLTDLFWLGKTEVTQAQWEALMGSNPSKFKRNDRPVDTVSWNDAMSFCKKLTEREAGRLPAGYEYCLPTEAEWEYACRAGSTGPYAGTGRLDEMGWYEDNSAGRTLPVAQKQPNAWGFYDMQGNVWEWCRDLYENYPAAAVIDPVAGAGTARVGVIRGGGWCNVASVCRAAYRRKYVQEKAYMILGFRVALVPTGSKAVQKHQEPAAAIRDIFLSVNVKLELLPCPAGTFSMGSPAGETGRQDNEIQHLVTLSKPFWLGKTETTQAQWQALMGDNPSFFKGMTLPVEHVGLANISLFCQKLTRQERAAGRLPVGYEYRLPTEAEWEYACRAGSSGPYAGSGRLDDMGWYGANSGGRTRPVAGKQPNAWGFFDMHGNVLEWCQDRYGDYPNLAVVDPAGSATGKVFLLRGGSWRDDAAGNRSAVRWPIPSSHYSYRYGFRVALAPVIAK
jgi:formylglycine-generating enzyme required for sulfatase activity